MLGRTITKYFQDQHVVLPLYFSHAPIDPSAKSLDLSNYQALDEVVAAFKPDWCIHAAAIASPDICAQNPEQAIQVNQLATTNIAQVCRKYQVRAVLYSTDYVFAGDQAHAYTEHDPVAPLQLYGITKVAAEQIFAQLDDALILRLSILYNEQYHSSNRFIYEVVNQLLQAKPVYLCDQQLRYPLFCPDVAKITEALLHTNHTGIFHLSGPEAITKFHWGQLIARHLCHSDALIKPLAAAASHQAPIASLAPRPDHVRLATTKLQQAIGFSLTKVDAGSVQALAEFRPRSATAITTLGGGSFAKSGVVKRFYKEARHPGAKKLQDEVNFLVNLPPSLQVYYPQVLRHGLVDGKVFMEQEYFELANFRQAIFQQHLRLEQAKQILTKLLECFFGDLYQQQVTTCSEQHLEQYYYQRVWHRLAYTMNLAPVFKDIIHARQIILNGQSYWNAPAMITYMQASPVFNRLIMPQHVSAYVHGDLHLENILIDTGAQNFKLVDPRGYQHCDVYYDFGKLSHSLNGKYDFLHQDKFRLSYAILDNIVTADLQYSDQEALTFYATLERLLNDYLSVYPEQHSYTKTLFAEAMHFCSDMPFHLQHDQVEQRAIAIYLIGVKIMHDCLQSLDVNFAGDHWTTVAQRNLQHDQQGWQPTGRQYGL